MIERENIRCTPAESNKNFGWCCKIYAKTELEAMDIQESIILNQKKVEMFQKQIILLDYDKLFLRDKLKEHETQAIVKSLISTMRMTVIDYWTHTH